MARTSGKGYGRNNVVATGSDSGDQVSVNAWNDDKDAGGMLGFTSSTKTISSGAITPIDTATVVAAEAGTTDNLDFITYSDTMENDILYLFADSGDTITVRHNQSPGAGQSAIITTSAANVTLSETVPLVLQRRSTTFYQIIENSISNVTATSTTTFTNKTIDQDGTGNSITNIADASIKASAAIAQSKIANLSTDLSGKSPTAGNTSLVTVGALDTGSITSGFGNINIGTSTFTTTGAVATGAITAGGTITGDLTGNVTGNTSGSSGSTTGNAATATTSTNVTVADESTDTSCNVLFTTAATGDLPPKSGTNLTFNSNTGILTATGFAGPLTGNVTGDVTGSSGSTTGNAATVTTNANLTGDVTSSGNATTIATDAVDIAMLSATGTAGSATFLRGDNTWASAGQALIIAASDETTALTVADGKIEFQMPYAFTLTDVRATLTTAGSTSGVTTIDIEDDGASIFSTLLTIDSTEKTSTTAATAAVISGASLADGSVMKVNVDVLSGGATEAGLKIYLIGYQT